MKMKSFICVLGLLLVSSGLAQAQGFAEGAAKEIT